MPDTTTIVVLDIESMKDYYSRLSALKEEVRNGGQKLKTLADQLSVKAGRMSGMTDAQGSNWQDPQYESLRDAIAPCVTALKQNAAMMSETTATIDNTIAQIDSVLAYLHAQIEKIVNI